jgi:hypothetical protein
MSYSLMPGWPINIGVSSLPCEPPTVEQFRARFPEFANISDGAIENAINDASCWADSTWIDTACFDCTKAIGYLAAHYLMLALFAATLVPDVVTDDEGNTILIPGGSVTSLHFESMSVSFNPPTAKQTAQGSSGAGIGDQYGLTSTPYGQRYLELLKVNKPAVLVV